MSKTKEQINPYSKLIESLIKEVANLSLKIKAMEEKFEFRKKIIADRFIPPAGESLD